MARLDTVKTIKKYSGVGKINPRYDLGLHDVIAIKHMDMGVGELIWNSFVFGYAQGHKATLAEMKKKECGI